MVLAGNPSVDIFAGISLRVASRTKTGEVSLVNTTVIRKIETKATMELWQQR